MSSICGSDRIALCVQGRCDARPANVQGLFLTFVRIRELSADGPVCASGIIASSW